MNSPHQEETHMPFIVGSEANNAVEKPLTSSDFNVDATLDPFSGISDKKRFNTGSIVLFLVVGVAFGGLWFMRSIAKAGAANIDNAEVEASIDKFLSSLNGGLGAGSKPSSALASDANVLAVLSGSYTERQVPLDSVQRNPFIMFDEPLTTGNNSDQSEAVLTRKQAERRKQFEVAAARLELKSVLMGSQPLANVGGKIVRIGDEIITQPDGAPLRVSEITKESVTFIGEDALLSLSVPITITIKR